MKSAMKVGELIERLETVRVALMSLSRLHLLGLLAAPDTKSKLLAAENASQHADAAVMVEEFLFRHYRWASPPLSWPEELQPVKRGVLARGEVDRRRLAQVLASLAGDTSLTISNLEKRISDDVLASPARPLQAQLLSIVPEPRKTSREIGRLTLVSPVASLRKAFDGPKRVEIDPIFRPSYSALEKRVPLWTRTEGVAMPHFWVVCIKETLGAELCALSAVEYDGLPSAFYRDMAQQAWDEMRHAWCYLQAAIELLPEMEASLDKNDPLLGELRSFRETGTGLPIPFEGNLYEAIWNSNLAERLVLFQLETEVPGSARKAKKRSTDSYLHYPGLARIIDYDLRDEAAHTEIGQTWLKYLVPDPSSRRETILETNLLRGVLVMTAVAQRGGFDFGKLLDKYSKSEKLRPMSG